MTDRSPKLRPYQIEGKRQTAQAMAEGVKRILTCAPTGAGKTVYAASILCGAVRKKKRVVFLAHRRELIDQSRDKALDSGVPDEMVGVIQAGTKPRANAPVQICSIDTLRARRILPPADLIIVDEAHRSLAASYRWLLGEYPDAKVIGLTATPNRTDGQGLGDIYERLILISRPSELIAQGYLVKPRVYSHPMTLDLEGVHVVAGEFNAKEVEQRANRPKLLGAIVDHWMQLAKGRPTVGFAVSVAHSIALTKEFVERGVAAEHIDGDMDVEQRREILARFKRGETTIVTNVDVLVEGWDAPWAKVLISARPTMSLVRWLQMCGRIMRPHDDVEALILDHAGNCARHGLPSFDHPWSLEGRPKRTKSTPADPVLGTKQCPKCWALVESDTLQCYGVLPDGSPCEYLWTVKPVSVAEGTLEEVTAEDEVALAKVLAASKTRGQTRLELTPELKRDYEKILRGAAFNGKSAAVAAAIFRRKHGGLPSNARLLEERFFPGGRSMFEAT